MLLMSYNADDYDSNGTYKLHQRVDQCIEMLLNAAHKLPRVAKDGSSECWFADEWFKEEADWRGELETQVRDLEEHYADATRAVRRAKDKVRECRASDDIYRLSHLEDARAEYEKHWQKRESIEAKWAAAKKAFAEADAVVAERRAR